MLRIFISHGTDVTQPTELSFLDDLAQELASASAGTMANEVLLDRSRLNVGDDWSGVLHD